MSVISTRNMSTRWVSLLLSVVCLFVANGELRLNGIFQSNMVLQEPIDALDIQPTRIFGQALLTETVTISGSSGFPGPFKVIPTTNLKNELYGNFSVSIIPNSNDPSYPGPYQINISTTTTNSANGTVTGFKMLDNVFFGDVFLCSGQSNMVYPVYDLDTAQYEESIAANYPNIRLANVGKNTSTEPYYNLSIGAQWQIPNNETIAGFSAICWMNGRMVSDYLTNTTKTKRYIGLIESNVGGTTVHFWAPPYVGVACNSTQQLPNTGECAEGVAGQLFNAMINPLSMNGNGISIRQMMYYQGEADTGENDAFTSNAYECELSQLIIGWRKAFNSTKLPFINIQLPPLQNGHSGADAYSSQDNGWAVGTRWGIQIAQNNVYKIVNNTGLVITMDQGQNTLHYPHKTPVAERATLWSRYLAYDDKSVNPEGPRFNFAYKLYNNPSDTTIYLKFSNVGSKGMGLINAYECDKFTSNQVQVYTYNATNVACCDMGGADVVRVRLEGIFVGTCKYAHYVPCEKIWNWVPANITEIVNVVEKDYSIIAVKPILPQNGCFNFPIGLENGFFNYTETIAVKKVEINMNPQCVLGNIDNGIPASIGGPFEIAFDSISQIQL